MQKAEILLQNIAQYPCDELHFFKLNINKYSQLSPTLTSLVQTLHGCFGAMFILLGVNPRCLFEGDACLIETSVKREFTLKVNMIYTAE